jgi:hypothetical protein
MLTIIASGRPVWPSRDPIGEEGGLNLYGFVQNNGVNKWDLLGQTPDGFSPASSVFRNNAESICCENEGSPDIEIGFVTCFRWFDFDDYVMEETKRFTCAKCSGTTGWVDCAEGDRTWERGSIRKLGPQRRRVTWDEWYVSRLQSNPAYAMPSVGLGPYLCNVSSTG